MDSAHPMLQAVGPDLVLIAPANPVDVLIMRLFVAGYFMLTLGLAMLADEVSVPARIVGALLGLLIGYLHGSSVVHNPREATRFTFQRDGRVVVSTLGGKALRSGPAAESRIVLRRKTGGPYQVEWKWALSTVVAAVSGEDFERLRGLGVPVAPEAPHSVRTHFTRSQ